jgi:UDP:flavonoid glycosyltransferase YjiC (YdhE family)
MRILCTSAPLPGHLDWGGFLATAVALQELGHEVAWASAEPVAGQLAAAGLRFLPLAETGWRWPLPPPMTANRMLPPGEEQRRRALRSLDQWLDEERVATAVTELGDVAADFRPHVIVSELFVAAAAIVAEQRAVPYVAAGWPAVAMGELVDRTGVLTEARQRLERLFRRCDIHGANWRMGSAPAPLSPHLHVTYWSPTWYSGQTMLPQTRHAGGLAPAPRPRDASIPSPDEQPWVLITLGTTFANDGAFFNAAARAAAHLGCLPIVVTAQEPDPGLDWRKTLPPGTILREHVDFTALLPHTTAAIHHGGAGTTHALITHGIPQLVVPHAGDQARQAAAVLRSGVGYHLDPKLTSTAQLTEALAAILPDLSPQRVAARALRDEFAALGGPPQAARWIEAVGKHRHLIA